MSTNVIVRYFTGWIKSESMTSRNWLDEWRMRAMLAEINDEELVVFSIPKNKMGFAADPETVEQIELLIQARFGTPEVRPLPEKEEVPQYTV